jgi:hypothetical protein
VILTFLASFVEGYQTTKKISFLGGPAHFVIYGGNGGGLVDNNNALTSMASALKTKAKIFSIANCIHFQISEHDFYA